MKNLISKSITGLLGLVVLACFPACNKNDDNTTLNPAQQQAFGMVNLVGSDASFTGARVDPHLINAWGISFSPTGNAWISAADDNSSAVYNSAGAQVLPAVTIPTSTASTGGSPTGQVFNGSSGFHLPSNALPAKFLFAQEDGIISGWNTGTGAVKVIDLSGVSSFTGLAIAASGTDSLIYAADFLTGHIISFNKTWTLQPSGFSDPSLPSGYAPFNIQNIGNLLYVMYAKVDPVTHDETKGAGLGIINVFNPDGSFVKRLITGGALNAPWGIAQAPAGWLTGAGSSTVLLVGNFGDGHINAYDASGTWLGTLETSNHTVITVDGLWGISFPPASATTVNQNWLYYAAGPADETKGLFGYITK